MLQLKFARLPSLDDRFALQGDKYYYTVHFLCRNNQNRWQLD